MRSQIKGMTDWAGQMNKLATMGIDQGLYKKLAEMGPQGAEYVGAFTSMTAEELAQANELWVQSLTLPGDIAGAIANDFNNIGLNIDTGLVNGISANSGEVKDATHEMVQENTTDEAMEVLKESSPSKVFNEIGFNIIMGLSLGIQENRNIVYTVMETTCRTIVEIAKRELSIDKFKPIGASVVEGVQAGIEENLSILETAVEKMSNLLEQAMRSKEKGVDANSPAKRFIPIGMMIPEGLAVGIDKNSYMVTKSISSMSSDAVSLMKQTIAGIATTINEDIGDPVIRPVLDLSNVQKGVKTLNNIFSSNQAINAKGSFDNLQNGQYSTSGNVVFNQYNTSPKALSRIDIYRDTKNLMSRYKSAMG